MPVLTIFRRLFKKNIKEFEPEKGYDIWAESYDDQPGNLMLALDEAVFGSLLEMVPCEGKTIIDVGCGTGRHWKKIFDAQPAKLIGYDVSEGMLKMLQQKFDHAEVHHLLSNALFDTGDHSCDILVSTLTMAHIENAAEAMKEWNRVLKPGGWVIITDYHPAVLEKGGKRTFKEKGKTIGVKNNIHTIAEIAHTAGQLQWKLLRLTEKKIDESVRHFYASQNALAVFESFKGMPVIYGMLFKKDDTAE